MQLKSYLSLLAIALLASSCSHGFYYKPDPTADEKYTTFLSDGLVYTVSSKGNTEVAISAMKPAGGQLQIQVIYKNNYYERVDAIPEAINVYALDGTKSIPLKVYSANQYLNKLQRHENSQMTATAFADAINNQKAGYSASSTTAAAVSSNGNYAVGSSSTVTYDASKVAEANSRSDQDMRQYANNFSRYKQSVSSRLLRDNTMIKGQTLEGVIVVNTSKSFDKRVYITIPLGRDTHEFVLMPRK